MSRISAAEWQAFQRQTKPHKFHAKRTCVDGRLFDSKKEARRWSELQILAGAGVIGDLRRQVVYALHAPVVKADGEVSGLALASTYIADFTYVEDGQLVVEDTKGVRTPVYRLKRKHMLLEYGIQIKET